MRKTKRTFGPTQYFVSKWRWFQFLPRNQLAVYPVLFPQESNHKCRLLPSLSWRRQWFPPSLQVLDWPKKFV